MSLPRSVPRTYLKFLFIFLVSFSLVSHSHIQNYNDVDAISCKSYMCRMLLSLQKLIICVFVGDDEIYGILSLYT